MNTGVPPTALKARTGELTPPGMWRLARSNSCSELLMLVPYRYGAQIIGAGGGNIQRAE
jgi:hypothetical protein